MSSREEIVREITIDVVGELTDRIREVVTRAVDRRLNGEHAGQPSSWIEQISDENSEYSWGQVGVVPAPVEDLLDPGPDPWEGFRGDSRCDPLDDDCDRASDDTDHGIDDFSEEIISKLMLSPWECPYCNGGDLQYTKLKRVTEGSRGRGSSLSVKSNVYTRQVICSSCRARWNEFFRWFAASKKEMFK